MQRSKRVFFLGAGVSVPDGYPITSWLVCAVAEFLHHYRQSHRHPSRLELYLKGVYGLDGDDVEASAQKWTRYVENDKEFTDRPFESALPEIIELLSLIDISIATNSSFGPGPKEGKRREFVGNELVRVRERVVEALVRGFRQIHRDRASKVSSHHVIKRFAKGLSEYDVVVTTNWDTLIEEAIRGRHQEDRCRLRRGRDPGGRGGHSHIGLASCL